MTITKHEIILAVLSLMVIISISGIEQGKTAQDLQTTGHGDNLKNQPYIGFERKMASISQSGVCPISESDNNSGTEPCTLRRSCEISFIPGLGNIKICQSVNQCQDEFTQDCVSISSAADSSMTVSSVAVSAAVSVAASSAAQQRCQTVRKCQVVNRPGIGKINVCRNELVCG